METVDKFQIEPLASGALRSHLVSIHGLTVEVEGRIIEAQFRCSLRYLVVLSDGNPYEEAIHFYLLKNSGEILDDISLGQIYHSGILRDIVTQGDDQLEFSFFGKERWQLCVRDKPRFEVPRVFSSARRTKGCFKAHYLSLRKVPSTAVTP
jgi:hypothetical protein